MQKKGTRTFTTTLQQEDDSVVTLEVAAVLLNSLAMSSQCAKEEGFFLFWQIPVSLQRDFVIQRSATTEMSRVSQKLKVRET